MTDHSPYTIEALVLLKQIQKLASDNRNQDAVIVAIKLARCALDLARALRNA